MALPEPLRNLRKFLLAAQRAAEEIETEFFELELYEIKDALGRAWLWTEDYTQRIAEEADELAELETESMGVAKLPDSSGQSGLAGSEEAGTDG